MREVQSLLDSIDIENVFNSDSDSLTVIFSLFFHLLFHVLFHLLFHAMFHLLFHVVFHLLFRVMFHLCFISSGNCFMISFMQSFIFVSSRVVIVSCYVSCNVSSCVVIVSS